APTAVFVMAVLRLDLIDRYRYLIKYGHKRRVSTDRADVEADAEKRIKRGRGDKNNHEDRRAKQQAVSLTGILLFDYGDMITVINDGGTHRGRGVGRSLIRNVKIIVFVIDGVTTLGTCLNRLFRRCEVRVCDCRLFDNRVRCRLFNWRLSNNARG